MASRPERSALRSWLLTIQTRARSSLGSNAAREKAGLTSRAAISGDLSTPVFWPPGQRSLRGCDSRPRVPTILLPCKDPSQGRTSSLCSGRYTLTLIFHGRPTGTYQVGRASLATGYFHTRMPAADTKPLRRPRELICRNGADAPHPDAGILLPFFLMVLRLSMPLHLR
jgi:hypothetical protein